MMQKDEVRERLDRVDEIDVLTVAEVLQVRAADEAILAGAMSALRPDEYELFQSAENEGSDRYLVVLYEEG